MSVCRFPIRFQYKKKYVEGFPLRGRNGNRDLIRCKIPQNPYLAQRSEQRHAHYLKWKRERKKWRNCEKGKESEENKRSINPRSRESNWEPGCDLRNAMWVKP